MVDSHVTDVSRGRRHIAAHAKGEGSAISDFLIHDYPGGASPLAVSIEDKNIGRQNHNGRILQILEFNGEAIPDWWADANRDLWILSQQRRGQTNQEDQHEC
jgi:hypothetical protein